MGAWNELTVEERELRKRLELHEEALRIILQTLSGLRETCGHRWQEEAGWWVQKRRFYPDNPTCLICGETDELKWYCRESPRKTCLYRDGNTQVEAKDIETDLGDCIYCEEPWARSR